MELHIVNIPPLEVQHGEGFIRAQGYQMKEWEETEVKRSWEEIHTGLQEDSE